MLLLLTSVSGCATSGPGDACLILSVAGFPHDPTEAAPGSPLETGVLTLDEWGERACGWRPPT
jgi:hypothetical protein